MPKKAKEPVMAEATATGVKKRRPAKGADKPLLNEDNTPKPLLELAEAHPATTHLTQPRSVMDEIFRDGAAEEEQEEVAVPATNEGLIKAAEEMFDLKADIDQLEAQAKQLKDRYDQLRKNIIPEAMKGLNMLNSKGKGSFTFSRGKIHLEQKLYASVSKENEPILFAFLEKEGDGDIIKMSVNASTLSAYIRERRGDGLNDPPGASVHEEVTAKLTKSK